jgi:D-tagatose-1,6-bisphosphate aldolase subunit GatZ/KbaZ-like
VSGHEAVTTGTDAGDRLRDLVHRHKTGTHVGIPSVCSAHPMVLRAALQHAQETGGPVLIEATSNQVDQRTSARWSSDWPTRSASRATT